MLALALAALLQTADPSAEATIRQTVPQTRALMDAVTAWDRCLDQAVNTYIVSDEPADVVATAAMWECRRHKFQVFDAVVAFQMAARPGVEESAIRLQLLADPASKDPMGDVMRMERTTYLVVTKRMGLPERPSSWDTPL